MSPVQDSDLLLVNRGGTDYKCPASDLKAYSGTISSVFGRTGVVTAQEGDYSLNLLSDVNLSIAPQAGQGLVFDGTTWKAGTVGSDGVSSFSGGSTGLLPSAGATGAITLSGTLAVANGGTGTTTSTGTGSVVLSNSPSLVTPQLGTPASGNLANCTGYSFSSIANTPTTLSGYGITDALSGSANNTFTGANSFNNSAGQTFRNAPTQDGIVIKGRAGGTSGFAVTLEPVTLTGNRSLSPPDTSGVIVTTGDAGSVTNTMLAGSIADSKLSTISTTGKVANSATTATSSPNANTIVQRDASGGFSAGLITAQFAGNGSQLTALPASSLTGTLPSTALSGSSLYVGTTEIPLNRASALQGLTGITSIAIAGATSGAVTINTASAVAGSAIVSFPSTTGTVVTTGDTSTVTNAMLAGSIADSKLSTIGTAGKVSGSAITSGTISGTTAINSSGTISTTAAVAVGRSSAGTNIRLDVAGAYAQNVTAIAALNIDCSSGNYFTKTISANSTFTVSNVPSSRAFSFVLELQVTSGSVTWFSGVEWPFGIPPSLSTSKVHLFVFVTDDGGSRWRGTFITDYTI